MIFLISPWPLTIFLGAGETVGIKLDLKQSDTEGGSRHVTFHNL